MSAIIESKKRQRGENWLEEDKIILKELVKERVRILENKNTDSNTNSMKVAAWKDLSESFNVMCSGSTRTITQLKAQWGLLKIKAKKAKAMERRELTKTGGGPHPNTKPTNSDDIVSWLPNEFFVDTNLFDSDEINEHRLCPATTSSKLKEPVAITGDSQTTSSGKMNIMNGHHNNNEEIMLEEPIIEAPPLSSPEKATKCSKKRKLISRKSGTSPAELVAACEIKCRKELHSIQMENEAQKKKNLELEEALLKAKLIYYKNIV